MTHDLLRPDVKIGLLSTTQHVKIALLVDVEEALTTVYSRSTFVNWRVPLPTGNRRPIRKAKGQVGRTNPLFQSANEGEITGDGQAIEAINGQHTAAGRALISGSQRVTPRFLQPALVKILAPPSEMDYETWKYENILRRPQSESLSHRTGLSSSPA